jgi:hypothetical protein
VIDIYDVHSNFSILRVHLALNSLLNMSIITGLDINVCPIPVKTDVGQVDLVLRLSDGTSEKIGIRSGEKYQV